MLTIYLYLGSALAVALLIHSVGSSAPWWGVLSMVVLWPLGWPVFLLEAIRRYLAD